MSKRKTIVDIAKECGVSPSTVSLVINNNPRISDSTRNKVMHAIEKNGYQPNIQARGLAMRSSRIMSVVLPDIDNVFADSYFGELLSGIYNTSSDSSYKIMIDLANIKFIRTQEYMTMLQTQRADGMMYVASTLYDQFLSVFQEGSHPFLLVNHYFPNSRLNYVAADHKESARLAAKHLLELGHRKVGMVTGTNIQTAVDFLEVFEQSLRDAGLSESDKPWADGRFSEEVGFEAAGTLLTLNPNLTAIMCGNDKMAIGVMRYIHSIGKRVPQDISVMGMDDVKPASLTSPKLTTISHNLLDLGKTACKALLALVREEVSSVQEMTPVHLVVRESTAPPRS